MIKAVLFDFDGTLINTNDLIYQSYDYAFKTVLGRNVEMREFLNLYGRPLYSSLMEYGECGEELYRVYREFNETRHDSLAKPFDGVYDGVKEITEKGYVTGIVTSKRLELVNWGLKILKLSAQNDFSVIITPEDTKKGKPDPEPILCACKKLNISPSEVIYVGDSEFDLEAGRAAGSRICAVEYSLTPRETLQKYKPDYFIGSIKELADMLGDIK